MMIVDRKVTIGSARPRFAIYSNVNFMVELWWCFEDSYYWY